MERMSIDYESLMPLIKIGVFIEEAITIIIILNVK